MKAEDIAKLNIKTCIACGRRLRTGEKLKCTSCDHRLIRKDVPARKT